MQPIDDNHYLADARERITVNVCVDKLPYLCTFEDQPEGSKWEDITVQGLCETRSFLMPDGQDGDVTYDASYNSQIADNDPDPKAAYTIKIRGSYGGSRTSAIVVPKGTGPIPVSYYFHKIPKPKG